MIRWAFDVADLERGVDGPTALVLSPAAIARLPPLRGSALADAAAGAARGVARRQVLAALVARTLPGPSQPILRADATGRRRLVGTGYFASVSERSGWAAAVVAREPAGIDLEAGAEAAAGAAVVFAGVDRVDPAAWHGPAGVWAAREAVLKAYGRDTTTEPGGWHFGAGSVTALGCAPCRVDVVALGEIVAAVAYVGG